MSDQYRSTVFLPNAAGFPMRARLPKREPETLDAWKRMGLYDKLREQAAGRPKFVLHDGPPYANGHLHMGHALNKILKDVINRAMQMRGHDATYVPGWDCHGLPIEWKVEERYREAGKRKDDVPVVEFRQACRQFAERWMATQIEEFQRFGVAGDWDHPYDTMNHHAEAQIVREIGKFLVNGDLYPGTRPVLWSVAEKTALADAEVEYHEHTSPTVWVRFPVARADRPELRGASAVIWTTTPWTLPGNRALACHGEVTYAVVEVRAAGEDARARAGERLVVAKDLADTLAAEAGIAEHTVVAELPGAELAGTVCAHPLREDGYSFDVPILQAGFVTLDQGTGIVHIAPGHGTDDWLLGREHGLAVPATLDDDGVFLDHVPRFAGERVYTERGKEGGANRAVIEALHEAGALLHRATLRHTYPHSWRSKVPLIFRATPQWFIAMDGGLRWKALNALERASFYPAEGKQRLREMIANRPDWCVSRQRRWGVPLPIFVHKQTGEPLRDPEVIKRIAAIFAREGGDAWYTRDPQDFLGGAYDANDYTQIQDVVEVWFDSGSTHGFVLEQRADLRWPADLYLEGSDQHRGWFHTSLLEAAGTRGAAPYSGVLTHGFVLDGKGHKMSKSMGNVIAPQDIMNDKGADILRLWVVAADYAGDLRISEEILRYHADAYRRIRNTLRFLIGNLHDHAPERERVAEAEMPALERWVLHRLAELDGVVDRGCRQYDFTTIYHALYQLCAVDLSAFYFDVRKDVLYCDRPDSLRRRACRTVLDRLYHTLTAWLAPILAFTAEEAWWARGAEDGPESVHLRLFPEIPASWRDDALGAIWERIRRVRRVVTGALEVERAAKRIGSGLEAHPIVHITDDALADAVTDADLAEVCITSGVTLTREPAPADAFTLDDVPGVAVVPARAEGGKCDRCWQIRPDVDADTRAPGTCGRCADAVAHLGMAPAE